ncbi:ankyrin repeat and protein kinase domain-containing protein 1-like [Schistocerca nitens]|uniref:ankyrin repeat and protein kinase domain-containing protein 1-like n=1 Tax=Schistocerca nitens TaxID=7011 RepID=UPI0021181DA6|nr:ankyrin repeat and protein kinase domain-containing protein 1-like [Schistocerca nitens]
MSAVTEVQNTTTEALAALLDGGEGSLVTLVAGETRVAAHRAVLAAASPVFAAMFAHDMLEASSGQVSIDDVEGPVLKLLVAYAYTLQAPQLPDTAPQLLSAADKYGLSALKAACERQLISQLAVETAAATAVRAVRHSCPDATRAAVAFIKDHLQVMATRGWADALLEYPQEVIEVSSMLGEPPAEARSLSAEERGRRLVEAAEEGAVGELRELIAAGADVVPGDEGGWTALHWAAYRGDVEAARLLVAAGAAVDARDGVGWTPLHLAAINGRREVADVLLDAGADRGATTGDGETLLDLDRQCNEMRLVMMLFDEADSPANSVQNNRN